MQYFQFMHQNLIFMNYFHKLIKLIFLKLDDHLRDKLQHFIIINLILIFILNIIQNFLKNAQIIYLLFLNIQLIHFILFLIKKK